MESVNEGTCYNLIDRGLTIGACVGSHNHQWFHFRDASHHTAHAHQAANVPGTHFPQRNRASVLRPKDANLAVELKDG